MRNFIIVLFLFYSILLFLPKGTYVQAEANVYVSAEQAVLLDQHSGRIIFEKNAHEQRSVASITKVMTALLAIEYGDLEEEVEVSKRATTVGGSSIYLQPDERMTLEDLLYGLMLRSGNDAAVAIAEHISGSVEGFSFLMNQKALYLGMTDTSFMNPHGLDEDNHYSSAYDIALLTRYAMENEVFQEISQTKAYHSNNRDYKWFNKNKLLTHLYRYSTGGKTGFTKKAGRTLVSTATKEDIDLIAVTLQAPNDWNDHIHLFETYFANLNTVLLERKGKRAIIIDDDDVISGMITEPVVLSLTEEEIPKMKKAIKLTRSKDDFTIGSIDIQIENETVLTVPIYRDKTLLKQIKQLMLQIVGIDVIG